LYKLKLIILLFLLTFTSAYAQQVKIGYIDKVKVLTELDSWKNIDQQLLRMKENAEFELQGLLTEADSLNNVLQNQMMLTETIKVQLESRIQTLSRDYQRTGITRQQELLQAENNLKGPILEGFNDLVRKIGIDEEFTLIYDTTINSILFATGGRDLTEQISQAMMKKFK